MGEWWRCKGDGAVIIGKRYRENQEEEGRSFLEVFLANMICGSP